MPTGVPIIDKRPRKRMRCLACTRLFVTWPHRRLCRLHWGRGAGPGRGDRVRVGRAAAGGPGEVVRDPGPALQIIAEASQLGAELEEALPQLAPESQLEARGLIGQLEETITTLGFALAAEDTAIGIDPDRQVPLAG